MCRLGSATAPATVLSPLLLVCRAPPTVTSATCLTETLEVTMNGQVFTQNALQVNRPDQVVLTSVQPSRVAVGSITDFVLTGRGIVSSDVARCRFDDTTFSAPRYYPAVYLSNPPRYLCAGVTFDRVTSSSASLSAAVDGQIFSTFQLPFSVIGQPAGIRCSPSAPTNRTSAAVEFSPPIEVFVVDTEGNNILDFDTVERPVYIAPGANFTFNYSVPSTVTRAGRANLTGFTLYQPDSAVHAFIISTTLGGITWTTILSVRITFGALAKLQVTKQPFNPQNRDEVVSPNSMIPSKTEVTLVDLAGSPVLSADGTLLRMVQGVVVNGTLLLQANVVGVGARTQVLVNAQGIAVLERGQFVGAFGWSYVFFFALESNPLVNVTTVAMTPSCQSNEFWVFNTTQCQACPSDRAICNGSDVLFARNGWWRPDPTSLQFYECPQQHTCVSANGTSLAYAAAGGMFCADGYEGPLCSVCSANYGRGFRGLCLPCGATATNVLQLVLLFLAFWLVLTLTLIAVLQNWRAPQTKIGRALVIYQMAILYMQTSSLLEFLQLNWAGSIRNFFSLLGTIADFRLNAIEAANCLFSAAGMHRPDMAVLYTVFLLFAPLVAVSAKVILTIRPTIFMSRESLRIRIKLADAARKPGAKKGAIYVKEHQRKTMLLVATQIVVFFIFQSAAYNLFEIFPCVQVQLSALLSKNYLAADMSVDCDSDVYAGYKWFASVMAFLFALIVPVGSFFFVGWMKSLYDEDYYTLYSGFMILGLRKPTFFWQSLIYVRKIVLIVIIVFEQYPLDSYFFVWFLSVFAALQLYAKPYESKRHNLLDGISLLSIIICGNLGLLYNVVTDETALDALTYSLLVIQSLTCLLFIGEMLRLLIWIQLKERRAERLRDDDVELEDRIDDIMHRLEQEERAPEGPSKESPKSFAQLMENRRLREEGPTPSPDRPPHRSTSATDAPSLIGNMPLSREALLPPDEPPRSFSFRRPSFVPPKPPRTDDGTMQSPGPGDHEFTRDAMDPPQRDPRLVLEEEVRPLYPALPQRQPPATEGPARKFSTSIVRPVELEEKHQAYLKSLEAERRAASARFLSRYQEESLPTPPVVPMVEARALPMEEPSFYVDDL